MKNKFLQQINPKNERKEKAIIWKQNFEAKREDLIDMCFNHEDKVKRINNILNEEEKNNGSNYSYIDIFRREDDGKKKGVISILPEKVQNNINETRRLNEELKRNVEEISKMNALYVIKHGNKFLGNESNSKNQTETEELPNINKYKALMNYENENKNKAPKNFRYINDNYRAQLMRAFLNFNPLIHLNNLRNLLEKADPAIQQDINNLWQMIERDLKEVLDPHYYLKKYKKIREENEKMRKKSKNITGAFEETKKMANEHNIPTHPHQHGHKLSIKLGQPLKPLNEGKRKLLRRPVKDKYEADMLKECMGGILHSIREENILKYIDDVKSNAHMPMERQIQRYFPDIKKTEEILKNIYAMKLNKNAEIDVKDTKSTVANQNDLVIKYIKDAKNELIKGITEKTRGIERSGESISSNIAEKMND